MRYSILALLVAAAGCGKEIGDACVVSSDCSPNGDRMCDLSQKEGYCTIMGCDYSTCPDEAVCVRFFTGSFSNRTCESSPDECSLDELCDLNKHCVPRSSEIRYCMKSCESKDDCRDGYQCRGEKEMKLYGGEPVPAPGQDVDTSRQFCAQAP